MSSGALTLAIGYLGIAACGLSVGMFAYYGLVAEHSLLRRKWRKYGQWLDQRLRFLPELAPAPVWQRSQVAAVLLLSVLSIGSGVYALLAGNILIAVVPALALERERLKRVGRLEEQLDGWLIVMANSLRASPSLGDALRSSASLVHAPMNQELDLLLKENHLGVPLDEAITNMSTRIGSRSISAAVLTMLIARQSGGDLPKTLEKAAATLREMARLEGVVRTKTAEGKAQAAVLSAAPAVVVVLIHFVSPQTLLPLIETNMGLMLSGIAASLWVSSFFVARKVLAVDI